MAKISIKFIDYKNVSRFCISVSIAPKPGESFKGFLLKAVQQGQTGAVGSFDTSDTTQSTCEVSTS